MFTRTRLAAIKLDAAPLPAAPRSGRSIPLRLAAAVLMAAAGFFLIGDGLYIQAKAALAQVLLERAFAQSRDSGTRHKPWPWADTWPVARLSVPRLGAEAIVLAGGSGQALAFGPGHLAGTPAPGEPGTSVIAAHRDTHFTFLGELVPDDVIVVERSDGAVMRFRVAGRRIVRFDGYGVDPGAKVRRLALVTCWPIGALTSGPLRLVVEAELVEARAFAKTHASVPSSSSKRAIASAGRGSRGESLATFLLTAFGRSLTLNPHACSLLARSRVRMTGVVG